jgi:hypothetical protein
VTDNLQRLLAGERRAHDLLDIGGITYFQGVQTNRLAVLARPILNRPRSPDPGPFF